MSERRACRVLGQHRSTQRKIAKTPDDEAALTADIIALALQYGRYGYRRITARRKRRSWSAFPQCPTRSALAALSMTTTAKDVALREPLTARTLKKQREPIIHQVAQCSVIGVSVVFEFGGWHGRTKSCPSPDLFERHELDRRPVLELVHRLIGGRKAEIISA